MWVRGILVIYTLLKNFSSLQKKQIPIESPVLYGDGTEWKIHIHPNGMTDETLGRYLSYTLQQISGSSETVKYRYHFNLEIFHGGYATGKSYTAKFAVNDIDFHERFCPLSQIPAYLSEYDCLKLKFSVRPETMAQKCRDLEYLLSKHPPPVSPNVPHTEIVENIPQYSRNDDGFDDDNEEVCPPPRNKSLPSSSDKVNENIQTSSKSEEEDSNSSKPSAPRGNENEICEQSTQSGVHQDNPSEEGNEEDTNLQSSFVDKVPQFKCTTFILKVINSLDIDVSIFGIFRKNSSRKCSPF